MSPERESLPPRVQPGRPGERAALPTDPSALPPLPDAFRDVLRDGLSALALGLSTGQLASLEGYVRLLLAWTEAINLTAIREPAVVAREHLLDSLSAVPLLRDPGARDVLDLGSGGGVPGIPLAIGLPDLRVLLVESVGKKAAFLRTAVPALGLAGRVDVAAERAEDLATSGRSREQFDAVTVRAVAALPELIELAFPLLRVGGRLIAWKREPLEPETAAGRNAARAIGGEVEEVRAGGVPGLADHHLVVVRKLRPTPRRYPRSPAQRRAQPL